MRAAARTTTLLLAGALALAFSPAPAGARAPAPAAFPETIALPDGFQPEGITSGSGTEFFVGSLATGAVWRGDFRTGDGAILVEGGRPPAVGVDYEAGRDRLWVAGGDSGQVKVYDAASGDLLRAYTVTGAGFLNDVAVADDAIYVTDSLVQQVVVLPLGARGRLPRAADTLPLTGDIQYGADFNVNGIVAAQDGRTLVLVQSKVGKLFRVDSASGVSDEIELTGGDVLNGDGLELVRRTLYVVQNEQNEVGVVKLTFDLRRGTYTGAITDPDLDVPTTATANSGYLWAVNARFSTVPTPTTEYDVVRLPRRVG
ncbi:MAG: superoxide dismutase [Geodermatophilaceae bacterium]|nr:superoxide dismutase [Geodermatophilaceae bacterium]